MCSTMHIVLDLRREDGSVRTALTSSDQVKRMLDMLTANCQQRSVTFSLSQYCAHVLMMEVSGSQSHDDENNT